MVLRPYGGSIQTKAWALLLLTSLVDSECFSDMFPAPWTPLGWNPRLPVEEEEGLRHT